MGTANRIRDTLRQVSGDPDWKETDRELLRRFVEDRNEAAFTTLMRRHCRMVLGVGFRVLDCFQKAEDVCQATFLLLAKKAAKTAWRDSVANWLYSVAYNLSVNARTAERKRVAHEASIPAKSTPDALTDVTVRELQIVLDEEIARLPGKYRGPVLLCCLEGKTRDEAAMMLGVTVPVVKRRLEEGRERLRRQLVRRGIPLSVAFGVMNLTCVVHAARLLKLNLQATSQTALGLAIGGNIATVTSPEVLRLFNHGVRNMFLSKLKVNLAFVFVACLIALGLSLNGEATPDSKPTVAVKSSDPDVSLKVTDILDEAARAIRKAEKPSPHRIGVLQEIAVLQMQVGNKEAASKLFTEIIDDLTKQTQTEVLEPKVFAQAKLACTHFLKGDREAAKKWFGEATHSANLIGNEASRFDLLQFVARRQAECSELEGARSTAANIQPEFRRGQVLADIANAQAKAGDVKGAIANGIVLDDFNRANFWLGLAEHRSDYSKKALQNALDIVDLLKAANDVNTLLQRSTLLLRIAQIQAHNGDLDDARKSFDEADTITRRTGSNGLNRRQFQLLGIAVAQVNKGDRAAAKKTVDEVLTGLDRADDFELLTVQIALGDFEAADKNVQEFSHSELRLDYLHKLAEARAKSGDIRGAYAFASKESDPLFKSLALLGVAKGMLKADPDKKSPAVPAEKEPPKETGKTTKSNHFEEYLTLRTEWEQQTVKKSSAYTAMAELADRFVELASKYRYELWSIEALNLLNDYGPTGKYNEKIIEILQTILDKSDSNAGQGTACWYLANLLQGQAELAQRLAQMKDAEKLKLTEQGWDKDFIKKLEQSDSRELCREAEKHYERVVVQYSNIMYSGTKLGDRAKAALFDIRNLRVGCVAPDIVGEDINGKKFSLSDYRGKVVVLVFCGHWCISCRLLYPKERELVKDFADQPFVLLHVNSDKEKDTVRGLMEKGEITWRAWWDGGSAEGPIATAWNVSVWPTVFVLDEKGVIRNRHNGQEDLRSAVRSLLQKPQ